MRARPVSASGARASRVVIVCAVSDAFAPPLGRWSLSRRCTECPRASPTSQQSTKACSPLTCKFG